jgi:heme exporter protein A
VSVLPFVEAREVSRTYGRTYALHRVSVRFERGTVTVVLGPNGAGKSTLLNILATLDRPTRGEVRYGPDWGSREMERQGRGLVGFVSHDSLVYGELTAAENLRFFFELYRKDDLDGRVARALAEVGLAEVADRHVRKFSRGMRQRLSIARALVNDPALLVLDEPLSGLDQEGRGRVWEMLADARERGVMVLLSTHVLDLPYQMVDQVVVMRRGRVRFAGRPEGSVAALYERVLKGDEPERASGVGGGRVAP